MAKGFWNSPVGMEIRWRQRESRTRRLFVEGEPERKGRRGGAARVVKGQQKLIRQLEQSGHPVLRGPVTLDLTFHVTSRQPAAIHHLTKYLLDALGPVHPENAGLGRRHVIYRDDKQVKLLHVHLDRPWVTGTGNIDSTQAGTRIEARPLRDVVEDLHLVSDLQDGAYSANSWGEDESSPFYLPVIPDLSPESVFPSDHASSSEQVEQWASLNKWLTIHDRSYIQDVLLGRTDALIASIVHRSASQICGAHPKWQFPYTGTSVSTLINEVVSNDRQVLLSGPLTLPMPGLPHISGERRSFNSAARWHLNQLFTRWPAFAPLLVPVKVMFLVVTPEQRIKDLDNIALEVLPLVHEILQPPLVPALLRNTESLNGGSAEDEATHKRLQYIQTNTVTAYEVIELTRHDTDLPHGHLRLALGSGNPIGSTWTRVTKLCEKFYDMVERP